MVNQQHWPWCRQAAVLGQVMDPVAKRALEEMEIPPYSCQMVSEDMPFIRLSWLLDETRNLDNLDRMQDLPAEAFLFPPEMTYAYFISHRWLAPDHPDRTGQQLAVALSGIWSDVDTPWSKPSECKYTDKTGVWYDFLCLPQAPRTRQEDATFERLMTQVVGLTQACVPLLVIDSEMEYASRAWCVAEAMGVYKSGFPFDSLSLAVQSIKYRSILVEGASAWDPSMPVDKGYRSGLAKLQSWLSAAHNTPTLSDQQIEEDRKKHFQCVRKAMEITLSLAELTRTHRDPGNKVLASFAARNGLQCTHQSDVPLCMRLMCDIITR